MLGLALLGVQAALPQHAPHHLDDLLLQAEEAAELAVGRPIRDVPGVPKKHICLRLPVLIIAPLIIAHAVIVAVGCVVDDVTHLLLSVVLAVIDGSGDRSSG